MRLVSLMASWSHASISAGALGAQLRTVFCIGYEVVSMTQRHDDDKLRHWLAAAAVVD